MSPSSPPDCDARGPKPAHSGKNDLAMTAPLSPEIVVVGSINLDVVVPVAQLPMPGQTVLSGGQSRHHGGKGHPGAGRRKGLAARSP